MSLLAAPADSGGGGPAAQKRGEVRPILVVDDEADARGLLAMILEMEGYVVLTASDGVEALAALRSSRPLPGLVLLDLMMPRLDGWGVMREIRASSELSGVPVLVLSGVADLEGSTAALGAEAAMTKPVDVDRLLSAIRRYRAE